jgi:D-glycero-D-manno-heptose 1,7-bisphosphate phosphatase
MNNKRKAIFIDKDGTLIPDKPYNIDPDKITLSDNCLNGLRCLQDHGYLLVIISNQSGVARGYFAESALIAVEQKISDLLEDEMIHLDGFYYCPHYPEGILAAYAIDCDCRKPQPGLLIKAADEMGIDLRISWMIGDILNDVEAGNRAGCKSVLIDNGNETEWLSGEWRIPWANVANINEAANYILKADEE